MATNKKIIVTFDVDGTLLTSGSNRAHKNALDQAIATVWDSKGKIDDLKGGHRGMTDQMIMADVLRLNGHSEEEIWGKMPDAVEYAVNAIVGHLDEYNPKLLPGIPALPEALARAGVCVCLVTGNLQDIGWLKMEKAGLKHCFVTGGFGSDHTERGELIKICHERAAAKFLQPGESFDAAFHVGDAPSDVKGVGTAHHGCMLCRFSLPSPRGLVIRVFRMLHGTGIRNEARSSHIALTTAQYSTLRNVDNDSNLINSASHYAGVKGIAVLTGKFTREVLEQESPWLILPDLDDVDHVVQVILNA